MAGTDPKEEGRGREEKSVGKSGNERGSRVMAIPDREPYIVRHDIRDPLKAFLIRTTGRATELEERRYRSLAARIAQDAGKYAVVVEYATMFVSELLEDERGGAWRRRERVALVERMLLGRIRDKNLIFEKSAARIPTRGRHIFRERIVKLAPLASSLPARGRAQGIAGWNPARSRLRRVKGDLPLSKLYDFGLHLGDALPLAGWGAGVEQKLKLDVLIVDRDRARQMLWYKEDGVSVRSLAELFFGD